MAAAARGRRRQTVNRSRRHAAAMRRHATEGHPRMNAPSDTPWIEANRQALNAEFAWLRRLLERIARDDGNGEEEVEPAPAATPTLNFLCTQFGLSEFERHVVLLCDYPSFGLALAVLPGAHWSALSPQAPLRHWHLVDLGDTHHLTSARLMLDERILHFLLGVGALDTRLAALARPPVTDIPLSSMQQ